MKVELLPDRLRYVFGGETKVLKIAEETSFIQSVVELEVGMLVCLIRSVCGTGSNYDHLAVVRGGVVGRCNVNRTDTSNIGERLCICEIGIREYGDKRILTCRYRLFLPNGTGGIHANGVIDLERECVICEHVIEKYGRAREL